MNDIPFTCILKRVNRSFVDCKVYKWTEMDLIILVRRWGGSLLFICFILNLFMYTILIDLIYSDFKGPGYLGAACCTFIRSNGP